MLIFFDVAIPLCELCEVMCTFILQSQAQLWVGELATAQQQAVIIEYIMVEHRRGCSPFVEPKPKVCLRCRRTLRHKQREHSSKQH